MTFNFENHGTNTYLVYQLTETDVVDTLSLGMITNNNIPGIARAIYTQMDNDRFIKYNIGSKTTLDKVISGQMKRKWLLGIFNGIVGAMQSAEDYMILPQSLQLDPEYVFVDLAKDSVEMVCVPLIGTEEKAVDFSAFFKSIMVNARFDRSENSDYIPLIMNYLNGTPAFSAAEFKKLLDEEIKRKPSSAPGSGAVSKAPSADVQRAPAGVSGGKDPGFAVPPGPKKSEPVAKKPAETPKAPAVPEIPKPTAEKEPKQEKKGGLWGLFFKPSEEKSDSSIDQFGGFAIPGMDNGPRAGVEIPGTPKAPAAKAKPVTTQEVPSDAQGQGFVEYKQKEAEAVSDDFGGTVYAKNEPAAPSPDFEEEVEMTMRVKGGFSPKGKFRVLSDGSEHIISKAKYYIGKDPKINDLCLNNNTVSRNKVVVETRDGACYIRDLGATNHVFINDQMIDVNVDCRLSDADIVTLGTEKLKFEEI